MPDITRNQGVDLYGWHHSKSGPICGDYDHLSPAAGQESQDVGGGRPPWVGVGVIYPLGGTTWGHLGPSHSAGTMWGFGEQGTPGHQTSAPPGGPQTDPVPPMFHVTLL